MNTITQRKTVRVGHFLAIAVASVILMTGTDALARQAMPGYANDGSVVARVKDRLARDLNLGPGDIYVSTNQGVVVLTGFADTMRTKHRAEQIAQEEAGVTGVENRINVRMITDGGTG